MQWVARNNIEDKREKQWLFYGKKMVLSFDYVLCCWDLGKENKNNHIQIFK